MSTIFTSGEMCMFTAHTYLDMENRYHNEFLNKIRKLQSDKFKQKLISELTSCQSHYTLCGKNVKQNSRSFSSVILFENIYLFIYLFVYLFIYFQRKGRGEGKRGKETLITYLSHALEPGAEPTPQACALTGNRTGDPSLCETALIQLSHTGQGMLLYFSQSSFLLNISNKILLTRNSVLAAHVSESQENYPILICNLRKPGTKHKLQG